MSGQTFQHEHRVSYGECTLGNHVYYARYLDILEDVRGEFFRMLGVPLLTLQEEDVIFPVIECRVRYRNPARYDDVLTVTLWMTDIGRVRLGFAYRVIDKAGNLTLGAETIHACTTRNEKPRRLPDRVNQLLTPFLAAARAGD